MEKDKILEILKKLRKFQAVSSENLVGLSKGDYDESYYIAKQKEYLEKYFVSIDDYMALVQLLAEADPNKTPEGKEIFANTVYVKQIVFY